ncbi:MAG: hypothetical protein GY811_08310 [Myxococcales bacterium]|nr:hypothetical protein [Myxococcales bacterium]
MDTHWTSSVETRRVSTEALLAQADDKSAHAIRRVNESLEVLEEGLQIEAGGTTIRRGLTTHKKTIVELASLDKKLSNLCQTLASTSQSARYRLALIADAEERRADESCAKGELVEELPTLDSHVLDHPRNDPFEVLGSEISRLQESMTKLSDKLRSDAPEPTFAQILSPDGQGRPTASLTNRLAALCGRAYEQATGQQPTIFNATHQRGNIAAGQQYAVRPRRGDGSGAVRGGVAFS